GCIVDFDDYIDEYSELGWHCESERRCTFRSLLWRVERYECILDCEQHILHYDSDVHFINRRFIHRCCHWHCRNWLRHSLPQCECSIHLRTASGLLSVRDW